MQSSTTTPYGLSANVAMGLANFFGPIGGLVILAGKPERPDVRFSAVQSVVLGVSFFAAFIAFSILEGVLGFVPGLQLIVFSAALIVNIALCLSVLVVWAVITVRAFTGNVTRLPRLAAIADRWVSRSV